MFKKVKITLAEALGASEAVETVLKGIGRVNWALGYRLSRQESRLAVASGLLAEARNKLVESLVGKEEFAKAATAGSQIKDILTADQFKDYDKAIKEELKSEVEIELLSESFEDLISPETELETVTAKKLTDLIEFFDERVWSAKPKKGRK